MIDVVGRVVLLQHAEIHHRDPMRERERLDLVVRHVDDGLLGLELNAMQLTPHLMTHLGLEVRERLVEQKDLRVRDQRAADGDALQLGRRELARLAPELVTQADERGDLVDLLVHLRAADLAHPEAIFQVLPHGHVREHGIVLEHEADIAPAHGHL